MEEGLLRESLIDEAKSFTNGSITTDMSKRSTKSSTTTAAVVFTTLVAVCGSFCRGCASGYSSPAESGIMEDLGLSVATIFPINVKASAGSLVTLVNWSCSWIVTYTFNFTCNLPYCRTSYIFFVEDPKLLDLMNATKWMIKSDNLRSA